MTPLSSRNTRCSTISGVMVSFHSLRFSCTSKTVTLACVECFLFQRIAHCVDCPLHRRIAGGKMQLFPDLFYCDVWSLIHAAPDICFVLCCQSRLSATLAGPQLDAACFPLLFRQPVRPLAHGICLGYHQFCFPCGTPSATLAGSTALPYLPAWVCRNTQSQGAEKPHR